MNGILFPTFMDFWSTQKCKFVEINARIIIPNWPFTLFCGLRTASMVIVSVLASSVVDLGFERGSGQTKDYTIGICCLSAKHAALWRKSRDWLARNQDSEFVWIDMFICGLLFQ